jgi:uncharacterized protein YacL
MERSPKGTTREAQSIANASTPEEARSLLAKPPDTSSFYFTAFLTIVLITAVIIAIMVATSKRGSSWWLFLLLEFLIMALLGYWGWNTYSQAGDETTRWFYLTLFSLLLGLNLIWAASLTRKNPNSVSPNSARWISFVLFIVSLWAAMCSYYVSWISFIISLILVFWSIILIILGWNSCNP